MTRTNLSCLHFMQKSPKIKSNVCKNSFNEHKVKMSGEKMAQGRSAIFVGEHEVMAPLTGDGISNSMNQKGIDLVKAMKDSAMGASSPA